MDFLLKSKLKQIQFPLKPLLGKLSFELKQNPVIEKNDNWKKYIPKPYKAVLVISNDFELAWAFRFSKSKKNPIENALELARLTRENVPEIVRQCEKYNVPMTWATVGHLFLNSCAKEGGLAHPDVERLNHFESASWKFDSGDWFKDDPCTDVHTDPEWYAPDLIKIIMDSPVKHEIGCHTFSHIDCRDKVCSPVVFESDLSKCVEIANDYQLKLESFVYPGHTFGNFNSLPKLGFTNYRTNYQNTLGYPEKNYDKLWEHKSSAEFEYRNTWSIKYQIYRYKKIIDRAIKTNTVCHFWFHPSFSPVFLKEILPEVLKHIDNRREELFITTMGEYTNWLNKNN